MDDPLFGPQLYRRWTKKRPVEIENKVATRAQLAADVERFVREGGAIQQVAHAQTGMVDVQKKISDQARAKRISQVRRRMTRKRKVEGY